VVAGNEGERSYFSHAVINYTTQKQWARGHARVDNLTNRVSLVPFFDPLSKDNFGAPGLSSMGYRSVG